MEDYIEKTAEMLNHFYQSIVVGTITKKELMELYPYLGDTAYELLARTALRNNNEKAYKTILFAYYDALLLPKMERSVK